MVKIEIASSSRLGGIPRNDRKAQYNQPLRATVGSVAISKSNSFLYKMEFRVSRDLEKRGRSTGLTGEILGRAAWSTMASFVNGEAGGIGRGQEKKLDGEVKK
jgi:hypothetical protein